MRNEEWYGFEYPFTKTVPKPGLARGFSNDYAPRLRSASFHDQREYTAILTKLRANA